MQFTPTNGNIQSKAEKWDKKSHRRVCPVTGHKAQDFNKEGVWLSFAILFIKKGATLQIYNHSYSNSDIIIVLFVWTDLIAKDCIHTDSLIGREYHHSVTVLYHQCCSPNLMVFYFHRECWDLLYIACCLLFWSSQQGHECRTAQR